MPATDDLASIVITVGDFKLTGLGPGDPLRFVETTSQSTMTIGAGGHGAFIKMNDPSGAIEVDLNPTSQDNGVLSRFLNVQKSTEGGSVVEVVLKDISGTDELIGVCTIEGRPAQSWGNGGAVRTWRFISTLWSAVGGGRGETALITFGELPEEADIQPLPLLT